MAELFTTSRYYVELKLDGSNDQVDAYFMECSGFKRTQDVIEIAEVTPQKWGKSATLGRVARTKMPGNVKSDNITLRFGMTVSTTFWQWFQAVEEGKWADQFRNGDITIYDQGAEIGARFRFLGAWPMSYKISDVKAGTNEFQVEEVQLAVQQFFRVE
jgi:phage tail-like protein